MYNGDEHKRLIETYDKMSKDNPLSQGNQNNLEAAIGKGLMDNPEYVTLSKEEGLVAGRAQAFEVLYNMVGLYREGEPVSGCYLFTMLRKSHVYAPGLTLKENLESFERMLDNLAMKDKKKAAAFKADALTLRTETVPYLQSWLHKNMISEKVRLSALEEMIEKAKSKKGNR